MVHKTFVGSVLGRDYKPSHTIKCDKVQCQEQLYLIRQIAESSLSQKKVFVACVDMSSRS